MNCQIRNSQFLEIKTPNTKNKTETSWELMLREVEEMLKIKLMRPYKI